VVNELQSQLRIKDEIIAQKTERTKKAGNDCANSWTLYARQQRLEDVKAWKEKLGIEMSEEKAKASQAHTITYLLGKFIQQTNQYDICFRY
jgi:hypothetical protein